MDETNNTPDVIDRNEMRGQIFPQPAKTAEFIVVDFNIMPTGASFPEQKLVKHDIYIKEENKDGRIT